MLEISPGVFRLDAAQLSALRSSPNGAVYREVERLGRRVLQTAVRTAPVDTGFLKNSLTMEMLTVAGEVVARVGTNVQYAIPVHEGHTTRSGRFVAGQPFLRDALEAAN